jgi:hypothetical protein
VQEATDHASAFIQKWYRFFEENMEDPNHKEYTRFYNVLLDAIKKYRDHGSMAFIGSAALEFIDNLEASAHDNTKHDVFEKLRTVVSDVMKPIGAAHSAQFRARQNPEEQIKQDLEKLLGPEVAKVENEMESIKNEKLSDYEADEENHDQLAKDKATITKDDKIRRASPVSPSAQTKAKALRLDMAKFKENVDNAIANLKDC